MCDELTDEVHTKGATQDHTHRRAGTGPWDAVDQRGECELIGQRGVCAHVRVCVFTSLLVYVREF